MTTAQPTYSLVWPQGVDPRKGYPLCPDCGHDFGSQHGGADPNGWCSLCQRVGPGCAVNHGAVFDAMDTTRAELADATLETALGDHFYRAACAWAEQDGEPVEALVRDRFLVAAQDAVAALNLTAQDGGQADG